LHLRSCGCYRATKPRQICRASRRALNDNAASIHRIGLAPNQFEVLERTQSAADPRLRDIEFGGEASDRLRAGVQVAGEKHRKLSCG
jgi:hypothetical protein